MIPAKISEHDKYVGPELQRTTGDWLLTFDVSPRQIPARIGANWQVVQEDENWHFALASQSSGWKGFPLLSCTTAEWEIWLLGELYGVRDSRVFLADWFAGAQDASELNGHFLLLARNSHTRQWHVWTDRFGTVHAYYASDGSHTALGTFSPAVAAAASQRCLDWAGLASFFALGFFAADRTHYEDVRVLRPASHYILDEDGRLAQRQRYWQWRYEPDPQRTYDDTVDQFAALFDRVMHEQSGGAPALPISGGLDSRSTVASLTRNGADASGLWAYSYGFSNFSNNSVETAIAAEVAAARELPFQAYTVRPYLFERLPLVLSAVEGFQDATQCRQAAILDELAAHASTVFAAHWGDVWLDDMGLLQAPPETATVLSHALKKMQKRGRGWLLDNVCRAQLAGQAPEPLVAEMIGAELARFEHITEADFRLKAFKTDAWSWRWTLASLRMYQPAVFPRLPFYDTRIADFFCTAPSDFVRGRRLQIDYLKRYAPDLARIRWQTYDANLYHYPYFNSWLLPKRALKKARRLLSRQSVVQRNWEVQFLNEAGKKGLHHWLLRRGLALHEVVAPAALTELLQQFYSHPDAANGYTVSMLLTFSAWLEFYG